MQSTDPADLWQPRHPDLNVRELQQAINEARRHMGSLEELKDTINSDIKAVVDYLTVDDIRVKTHNEWPELCPCDQCHFQRFRISEITADYPNR